MKVSNGLWRVSDALRKVSHFSQNVSDVIVIVIKGLRWVGKPVTSPLVVIISALKYLAENLSIQLFENI